MTTDLERLEMVRSGKLTERGCGKTYAACYSTLEWIRNNPEGIVFWPVPKMSWVDHIRKNFDLLYEEFGMKPSVTRYKITINKAKIIFFPKRELSDITRGHRNYHFIYDSMMEIA